MSETIPILDAKKASPAADRLAALFDDLESKQLDFLDAAGKRITELCTTLLGVVFALTAFGGNFPPPYLKGNALTKGLLGITLLLFLAAILISLYAIQPRTYARYDYNVSKMRETLDSIIQHKSRGVKAAGLLFLLGVTGFVALIASIVWRA